MIDVLDYISNKGLVFKREGSEILIFCPSCGRQKLSININSGLFQCWHCQGEQPSSEYSHGHISRLVELFGDALPIHSVSQFIDQNKNKPDPNYTIKINEYHSALLENKYALRYLVKRGISIESIKRFKLGLAKFSTKVNEKDIEHEWISVPSYEGGIPKLIKYRQLPPEHEELGKYIREAGGKSILFNGDILDKFDEVILTEGEIDAIILLQAGYENVVGITGGAGTLLPPWQEKLSMKSKIYLCLDADPVGQKAAFNVWATRLGINKCWNVLLPEGFDINKYFLQSTKNDFDLLLKSASLFKSDGLLSLTDALYDLYLQSKNKDNFEKFALPWKNVNKLIGGGLSRKHLTVLGGIAGSGKTTFAMQILWHLAKTYKLPGLFFCLEMPETQLAIKVVQLNENITFGEIRPDEALVYSQHLEDLPIYFGYSSKVTPNIFYNTMKAARDRYGVEFGVFDKIQRMVRTGEKTDMGRASGMFKDLVMDLNIPFILISQPRKLNSEEEPTYDDLKGSSSLSQDPDLIILIHRRRQKALNNEKVEEVKMDRLSEVTEVIVDKSRYASGGFTRLTFIGNRSKFVEET
jgi:KaiC/GvpD/RAD55 family RecA-like ATPase